MKSARLAFLVLVVMCVSAAVSGQKPVADVKSYVAARVVPPETLTIENIPPIPMELAESVKKYTEVVPVSGSQWHPVRREILIGKRSGNATQVHLLTSPLGALKRLTDFPDPVGGGNWEPNTGKYFLFFKATGGNEISQLYRYDADTGQITRLTTNDKMRIGGGPWTTAGDRYTYTAIATGAGTTSETIKTEIWTIDPTRPDSAKLVATLDGVGWGAAEWTPDDKKFILTRGVSVNESYLYLYDPATGEKKLLTPQEGTETVSWGGVEFNRTGTGFYTTTDKGSEFQRLVFFDLATGKITPLTAHINWDVEGLDLSEDGRWLAFSTNENGRSVLHVLDTTTNTEVRLPKLPGNVTGVSWHKKTGELGMNISSFASISDVYSLDIKTGKLTHWAKTEMNGFDARGLREPELIKWKSFDGMEISGFIYKPPAAFKGKRPVIINIHGGPEGQARPGPQGRNSYYINDLGVAMIYPNVRGSSGYGKTFLKLDNGYKREDSVKDIGALLDWIAKQPDLDKDRVLVTGGSYGGYMTLAVATHYNDRIRASIDVVGISNFLTFLKNTETYRRDLRRVEYGDERDPKMYEFLEKISPLTHVNKITKPIMIVQGRNDPRVPYTESEQMAAAIKKNGTPVWFLMAADEGHGFSKKNNVDYQFYSSIMFVKEFLLK
jgi:dipeptidyl aminopeptidase/acylaminoacyl peptidase